jgi:histidine triad (HIT) family protein
MTDERSQASRVKAVSEEGCIFCGVVAGDIPGDVVRRTERVVAFRDLNPQAPTHVLVIPVDHYPDVTAIAAGAPEVLAELVEVGAAIAAAEAGGPYRLVFNTGAEVGQSVFHVHGHVLAGRSFGWPPG